jgi:hypothetical protein
MISGMFIFNEARRLLGPMMFPGILEDSPAIAST